MHATVLSEDPTFAARRLTADRIFYAALAFNAALTVFWVVIARHRVRLAVLPQPHRDA